MDQGRIIITGALGHIGSYFIRQAWMGDFKSVLLIDNLSTQRYASLFKLPPGLKYHFIQADIANFDWKNALKRNDTIIHLAAVTDAESSVSKRDLVFETNLRGTQIVAQACLDAGCRLVFPSTTSVYGVQEGLVDETCQDLKPQSPYAESKIEAETLLTEMASRGLRAAILRLGTIFGASAGMRFHTAVNKFLWQARWGLPVTVWETAFKQQRPYLSLDDASNAVNFVLRKDLCRGETYNIVTANHTVEEITEAIREFVPNLKIDFVQSAIMNQLSYQVSAQKIIDAGLSFKGDLRASIQETLSWLGYGL